MNKLYFALFLLSLSSCKPDYLSPEKLSAFVADEDNGLKKSVTLGETRIDVTYRPTDLLVHQETGNEPVDVKKIEGLRKKYSQYLYFILSLSNNSKEALHQTGRGQYSELVQTLSFRMHEYVTLTTAAHDTIPVDDFILNRTYGLSSSTDVLFVFNKGKSKEQNWVQFNLNEFGLGAGNQRFRFSLNDIDQTPEIDFNIKN